MENRGPMVLLRERCKIFKRDLEAKLKTTVRINHPCISWLVEKAADIINKSKLAMMVELPMKDSQREDLQRCDSCVWKRHSPPDPRKTSRRIDDGEMGARSVAWERFTTDEARIGLENGKVVRTRNVRPKSLEDTGSFHEIDKIEGQPWDPSVTLTYEKLRRKNIQGLRSQRQLKKSMSTCPGRT